MPRVLPLVYDAVPERLANMLPEIGHAQFLVALLFVTALPYLLVAAREVDLLRPFAVHALLTVQSIVALNVASHLAAALLFGGYVPGLVTAVAVNLPFSVFLFRRAAREGWLSRKARWSLVPLALLLHGPGLLVIMLLIAQLV